MTGTIGIVDFQVAFPKSRITVQQMHESSGRPGHTEASLSIDATALRCSRVNFAAARR